MRTMRILITGANGYIGSHVVTELLNMGTEVIAVDIDNRFIDKRCQYVNYNIFQSTDKNLYEFLGEPDACLHLAWRDGFVHNSTKHLHDLSAHFNFLTNLISGGLRHLAVMGTMHEVGYHEGKIDENTSCNPTTLYAIAKNALRQSLTSYIDGSLLGGGNCVIFKWLRGFYIYGDDERSHSIFAKITQSAKDGKTTFPFTSGRNKYDFIEVHDLAHQIAMVLMQENITGIINCCSGVPLSLSEVVERYIKEHNYNIHLQYGAFPDRPYDSPCIYGDATKINEIMRGVKTN